MRLRVLLWLSWQSTSLVMTRSRVRIPVAAPSLFRNMEPTGKPLIFKGFLGFWHISKHTSIQPFKGASMIRKTDGLFGAPDTAVF